MTGSDLIAAGYEPGPWFKEILGAVEDAQLDGRLASLEAAMEWVGQEFLLSAPQDRRSLQMPAGRQRYGRVRSTL